ncbi:unnamed protein product [Gordionus sp. m RMFG-2023]|uniref:5-oxoprolinase-like isoform X2 n=1 Tax=Gordionus sp. m RMFG-2023 TaxID=3053472 RepID=UPI0030DE0391
MKSDKISNTISNKNVDGSGGKFKFGIDRGGTFTDIFAICPDGSVKTSKLLSENPDHYNDAPYEGIRRIINEFYGENSISNNIRELKIEWIRIGTTLATNALLERKGEKMALIITKGFKDVLYIGNQARPQLFDLNIVMPDILYESVIEVNERVILDQSECQLPITLFEAGKKNFVTTKSGEKFIIWKGVDHQEVERDLKVISDQGIKSVAVVMMHAYGWNIHEEEIERLIKDKFGDSIHVSLSSRVMPMVNIVARGQTTCVDAYLTPCIKSYVSNFVASIEDLIKWDNGIEKYSGPLIHFMQSDGGLVVKEEFIGSKSILSGPAGGVVGYSITTYNNEVETGQKNMPVIGFDMGGTSTDVSRFDGNYEHVYDSIVAGIVMQCPQLDIQTVAAGGGSCLLFRKGLFVVGPESSGSEPGPKCYRKNGPLCVTDANLCLNRLLPQYFPKVFGPDCNQEIDLDGTASEFDKLTKIVNTYYADLNGADALAMTREQLAMGFITVANETMSRTILNITQAKGYETSKHILACFGSAAGQHACSLARLLGINKIFIHKYSGILSAYGMSLANVVHEEQESLSTKFLPVNFKIFCDSLSSLESKCRKILIDQNPYLSNRIINHGNNEDNGEKDEKIKIEIIRYIQMGYEGTHCPIMCQVEELNCHEDITDDDIFRYKEEFLKKYQREFGFILPGRDIVVDNIRVRCIGKSLIHDEELKVIEDSKDSNSTSTSPDPKEEIVVKCYFQVDPKDPKNITALDTKVYLQDKLPYGFLINGPAIVISLNGTILIEPGYECKITCRGNLLITVTNESTNFSNISNGKEKKSLFKTSESTNLVDPIKLSLFCHRFMSIAERMGRMLKLTALSTNIKERLDFSCAVFAPDGGLIANAPHIPVHLGSMQQAVKYQIETIGKDLKNGDVILTNHPCAGGSHLPDLTVIKPYFKISETHFGSENALFWVASRGHHADIGGILPGSMPAHSTKLSEEGATFKSFKIVQKGLFREKEVIEEFMKPGKISGSSGARRIHDNIADLKAQIAACQKGIQLVEDLIQEYGLKEVLRYMNHIRINAAQSVRDMLRRFQHEKDKNEPKNFDSGRSDKIVKLSASDYMDNGTLINLNVYIDTDKGSAIFDFTGTGYQVMGNCNTPKAITLSALIYCLRCMIGHDIPMNQGCLDPVDIIIPKGSILDPSEDAAVVGGNVQTSQRIVDVIFKAFNTCAASQGCMNNVTFGDGDCVYYETIAGGSGAGPSFDGRSAVHTHMTNTRITDPEILERRFPVILKRFGVRDGSGGSGKFKGGNGAVREILFRKPLNLSILTERRVFEPYGMNGGANGKRGLNLFVHSDGKIIYMDSKSTLKVDPGDTFQINTPGGGGYGVADSY